MSLPIPASELARRLSVPQDPRSDGWRLDVTSVEVVGKGEEARIRLLVNVIPTAGDAQEKWEITLPWDPRDMGGPAGPGETIEGIANSTVFVLRANLEEWWYTKAREAHTAAWGRRVHAEQGSDNS
ncbi:MAG TPA: hypothetical protein VI248_26880 [Kineosporiaceae bacterium]